ncbi:hypothetical protein ACFQ9J_19200 [Streptomyces sp. NPDC056529]|uniref:hypothetical protein n=1 Tax=Streptomyces sp. NPDC056529 TaxID=3345855 RepID=UPI0036AF559F
MRREGRLPDAVAEALLVHGRGYAATRLHGRRVSPAMRRRIAEHPDPAIRDAFADFVRSTVESGVGLGIEALVETYGLSPAELAADPDPELRAAIAQDWHDRPAAVQKALLTDPDPGVRAAASRAEDPGVPPELHERCLADPAVRADVAHRFPLTAEQFDRLLATGDESVLGAVAGNPYLTAAMVARLQDSEDPGVRVAVAYNRHTTPDDRDRLLALVEAEKAAGGIEAEVALHWSPYRPDWLREAPLAERLTYLNCPSRSCDAWGTARNRSSAREWPGTPTSARTSWNDSSRIRNPTSPTTPRPTPYCPEHGWTASPPKPASEAPRPARAPTPAPYGAYSTGGRGEITRSPS